MEINYVEQDDNGGTFEKFEFDLQTHSGVVGIDTETSSLDTFTCTWYLLQVCIDKVVYLFDVQKLGLAYLKDIVQQLQDSGNTLIAHNAKYDIKVIKTNTGIILTHIHDTMWTETLIHLGLGEVLVSLSNLVEKYLGIVMNKSERVNFYTNYTGITQELLNYSTEDVIYLSQIYELQMKQIRETKLDRVQKLESELVPVVADMEYNGVLLDKVGWTKMAEENKVKLELAREVLKSTLIDALDYGKYQTVLEAVDDLKVPVTTKRDRLPLSTISGKNEMRVIIKNLFNFGSHTQMLRLLNLLGVDILNTNEKTLTDVKHKYEFVSKIVDFREMEKKESTYGLSFLENIHPVTGRIHTEFLNLGTRTGRFSSGSGKGKPNLQNIPRESEYRERFIARPRHKLLAVDYGQQEYRLVGAVSNEPVIIQAYLDGMDMHTATAMIATGKSREEITKEDRSKGKTLNFAIIYGSSEWGLSKNLKIKIEEGRKILEDFYHGYPVLAKFKKAVEKVILERKYSITPMGRRRYFESEPLFADSRELMRYRGRIAREGFNTIIQGGGADITKLALVNLFYNNPFGEKFKLLLQIHDEIVAEVDDSIAEEAKIWMEKTMLEAEQPFLGKIPAAVDGSMANYWVH